jgi:hypothetical protein
MSMRSFDPCAPVEYMRSTCREYPCPECSGLASGGAVIKSATALYDPYMSREPLYRDYIQRAAVHDLLHQIETACTFIHFEEDRIGGKYEMTERITASIAVLPSGSIPGIPERGERLPQTATPQFAPAQAAITAAVEKIKAYGGRRDDGRGHIRKDAAVHILLEALDHATGKNKD